jgi:hypothetical protein
MKGTTKRRKSESAKQERKNDQCPWCRLPGFLRAFALSRFRSYPMSLLKCRKRGHSGFLLGGLVLGENGHVPRGIPDPGGRASPCGAAVCGAERVAGAVGAARRAVAMVFAEGLGGRARRCAVAPRPGASGRRLGRLGLPAAKRSRTLGLAHVHRAVYAVRRGVLAADHSRPPRAGVQPPPPRQTEAKRMMPYPTTENQNVPFFPSGK